MNSNVRYLFRFVCPCLLCLLFMPAVAATPFSGLSHLHRQGVAVTALAVDMQTGQILAGVSPDNRLVPASLSKLFTAAVALRHWGAGKTFDTALYTNGHIDHGHLAGDLILKGKGGPGLVSEQLWPLIGALKNRGITEIAGDLLVDAAYFGELPCQTPDRCRAKKRSRNAYDALPVSAGINYGAWCVQVSPGAKTGEAATVSTCPFGIPAIDLVSTVKTVAHGQSLQLHRKTGKQGDKLIVSGVIGKDHSPAELYVSAGNPLYQAGVILSAQLAMAGIQLDGKVRVIFKHPSGRQKLATVTGASLAVLVKRMLNYSNNYMADTLALDLRVDAKGKNGLTLNKAGRYLLKSARTLIAPMHLRKSKQPPVLASGSGLTTKSRLSARDLTTLLAGVYANTDIFPAFVAGLTVPAYSPLGILRGSNPVWQQRVMVKSGSLNQPHTVYAIAGYVRTFQGHWVAFAIILNGTDKQPHLPYGSSMKQLRKAVTNLAESDT